MKMKLDRIDLKIMTALQADGRLTNKELADKVGLSQSPCLVRVRRLEKAGLIECYMAIIDLKKLVGSITVMSQIYMHESDLKAARLLEAYLLQSPQTVELYDVNGECDYVARFVCRNIEDYSVIARALLEDPAYRVRQIMSHVVLRQLRAFRGHALPYLTEAPDETPLLG